MCGICGALGGRATVATIERMMDQMIHRGPDGGGSWSGAGVALGHRRLAIVDLSERGRQPMVTADGALAATVNGEIYNYAELRRELEGLGAAFASDCDSEVVLHAYRAWGTDAFARFNGMFAFGLWDSRAQRLHLVRDRLGIKPLYYFDDEGGLLFASDTRAILAATGARHWRLNEAALGNYLAHQNVFGSETLFAGIRAVRPGTAITFERSGTTETSYWTPQFSSDGPGAFGDAVDAFRETLEAAVGRHLMSDVPVAAYLSSGFDSSMVASVAVEKSATPPATFTGGFNEGGWYDERTGAGLVARHIGSTHTDVTITAADFRERFDDMVFALDEPRMGIGAFCQFIVAEAAARTHKVILTGHGGDELFSGYPIFKAALLRKVARARRGGALRLARSVRLSELPHLAYFAMRAIGAQGNPLLPMLFPERELRSALKGGAQGAAVAGAAPSPAGGSLYEAVVTTYLCDYLPGLLTVEDKISMAHSLESRTPLLDNAMVELALSIPEETKLTGGVLKAIVKEAARGRLPAALHAMPKRGFPTPLAQWLRGDLAEWMSARIAGPETRLLQLFERDYLERTCRSYLTSWRRRVRPLDEIRTHRMWMLLSLESWLRQYEERAGIRLELGSDPGESSAPRMDAAA